MVHSLFKVAGIIFEMFVVISLVWPLSLFLRVAYLEYVIQKTVVFALVLVLVLRHCFHYVLAFTSYRHLLEYWYYYVQVLCGYSLTSSSRSVGIGTNLLEWEVSLFHIISEVCKV